MLTVSAPDGGLPAAPYEFLRGEVAPGLVDVAFVAELVEHDGLAPPCAPGVRILDSAVEVEALNACVGDPRTRVVVEFGAIVDAHEVVRVVFALHYGCKTLPIVDRLGRDEVELVGHRPPDIRMSCQPTDDDRT